MRKKWILFVLFLTLLFFGGRYFFFPTSHYPPGYCAFCDPAVLERQSFYEDEWVRALYTHKPVLPGHCLVIPKRHVERFEYLTETEIAQMGEVLKKVNQAVSQVFGTSSYLLLQKNGREVGQSVPHVHIHYIPQKAGDKSVLGFLAKIYVADAKKPIPPSEMQSIVGKLKQAIGEAEITSSSAETALPSICEN